MNLEKRVEILEQEVEVLKNQIQSTLLDIKEQILTNTHPNLRADGSTVSHDQQAIHNFSLPPDPDINHVPPISQTTDMNAPIPVNRVSLDNIQPRQITPPTQVKQEPSAALANDNQDWATMRQLEEWVNSKVREMGPDRTKELIYIYAENGHFDKEVATTLLQLLNLYESDHKTHKVRETRSLVTPPPSLPEKPRSRKHDGAKAQRQKKNVRQSQQQPSRKKRRPKAQAPSAKQSNKPKDDDSEQRQNNLVLRLIAGVQTAGTKMNWRKKHG